MRFPYVVAAVAWASSLVLWGVWVLARAAPGLDSLRGASVSTALASVSIGASGELVLVVLATYQSFSAGIRKIEPLVELRWSVPPREWRRLEFDKPSGLAGLERSYYGMVEAVYRAANQVTRFVIGAYNRVFVRGCNQAMATGVAAINGTYITAVKAGMRVILLSQLLGRLNWTALK